MYKFILSFLTLGGLAAFVSPVFAADPEMKFELYRDKSNDYRWCLKDSDGAVVAVAATGHKQRDVAKAGLESFRKFALSGELKFDTFFDEAKQYRWRLVSDKGDTVAVSSGGYRAEIDADRAIASLKIGVEKAGLVVLK